MSDDDDAAAAAAAARGLRSAIGIPVDASGGPTIDPTKNVLDLVRAESKYQDAMRDAFNTYQNAMREELARHTEQMRQTVVDQQNLARSHDTIFQNYARDSEARMSSALRHADGDKNDKLAQLRQVYETRIADMLSKSVDSTQSLVASQLIQIQATFNERVSKLEEFRWSSVGKTSVADPATSEAISRLIAGQAALKLDTDAAMIKLTGAISSIGTQGQKTQSERMGQGQVIAWIVGAAMLMAAIATPLIAFLALRPHP